MPSQTAICRHKPERKHIGGSSEVGLSSTTSINAANTQPRATLEILDVNAVCHGLMIFLESYGFLSYQVSSLWPLGIIPSSLPRWASSLTEREEVCDPRGSAPCLLAFLPDSPFMISLALLPLSNLPGVWRKHDQTYGKAMLTCIGTSYLVPCVIQVTSCIGSLNNRRVGPSAHRDWPTR